jgi:hypothetical protein
MSYGYLQRWRRSTRTAVVREEARPTRRVFRLADIERGWLVRDAEGRRLGTIGRSENGSLSISRGFLGGSLTVPSTYVAQVHEGGLTLNVSLAWIQARGRGGLH